MFNSLICWIFGHKFVIEASAGYDPKGIHLYRWRTLPFCARCGKPNSYQYKE
jgi:hypothetical protein